ncbi:MAG: citrate synthase [Desulfatibacillaceae bacterium]
MAETVKLVYDGKEIELPLVTGTEGEQAIDITRLRKETGLITLDPGFANTGSCKSAITFMDGEKGILRYRGFPIDQLAEKASFVEVAFLLINGTLPTAGQLGRFNELIREHSLVHEDMRVFFGNFPPRSHPMGILSSMVNALRSYYPELRARSEEEEINITLTRLISKVRTMAAMSYKISRGHKVVYPRHDLDYCANFLYMMHDSPVLPYEPTQAEIDALDTFWILHGDHEQNCSTSAVRLVGSGRVNVYAAISAGIAALWGPLHGGANQAVIEMLEEIRDNGGDVKPFVEKARDKNDPFRLMGFGHRVYKTYDPRARIIQAKCGKLLEELNVTDPLLDIARELEQVAVKDDYFISHNLYPNVDFYSGIVLRALRIPTNMFPVMFAIGRMPGWIAQWKEDHDDPNRRLYRPRQVYVGSPEREFLAVCDREPDACTW